MRRWDTEVARTALTVRGIILLRAAAARPSPCIGLRSGRRIAYNIDVWTALKLRAFAHRYQSTFEEHFRLR